MWSQLKLLQHKDTVKEILNHEISIPTHIQFEFTESCNYSCTFCPWHGNTGQTFKNIDFTGKRFFDYNRFSELVDELEELGVKAVSITGSGENLIHPQFNKFIEKLSSSSIEFALTSNFGVKLDDKTIKNLLKAKWIRWSVNAADEKTYNETNRPKVKEAYFISQKNIKNLVKFRETEKVHLGASFVIGDYNKHNILDVTKYTKSLGIDSISFRPDTPMLRKQQIYQYDNSTREQLEECKTYQTDLFKVFVNYGRLEDSMKIEDKELKCY